MNNAVIQRIKDFQKFLKKAQLSGYVALSATELRYFTGIYHLDKGEVVLLITSKQVYAFTKKLLALELKQFSFLKTKIAKGDMLGDALDFARKTHLLHVAFNPSVVDFVEGEKLVKAGLSRLNGAVEDLRTCKYTDETERIKKACQIAASAFAEVKPQIKTGMSEEDVRILIATAMTKHGAHSIPFNIVSFGENCADCHHMPSAKRKLKKNDAVLMDFGCYYQGYCSDMTRSWWHGDKEPAEYTKIWHLVHMAKESAVKRLQENTPLAEIDKTARDVIEDAGYGEYFIHTTGHGIGLHVHESPILRKNGIGTLEENNVVTVEPGIYLPGKYGVRLEDSYLVTKKGAKNLTGK